MLLVLLLLSSLLRCNGLEHEITENCREVAYVVCKAIILTILYHQMNVLLIIVNMQLNCVVISCDLQYMVT